jgi:pimeloyl-ACP methyl ester carboxylesterase
MTTFVLVHGAWRGAWAWKRLRPILTNAGHSVFAPTLSGLADRRHLLTRDIGLDTHVDDICNLLVWEELNDVILVGHSYGGFVVRHVADRFPDRIRSLIYLDAFVPEDGRSLVDYLPDGGARHRSDAVESGKGWMVPPIPASNFGDKPEDSAWIDRQSTMQPLATFESGAQINGACDRVGRIGYIHAANCEGPFRQFYDMAQARGWWRDLMPCGHDIMTEMPEGLAKLLLRECA